MTRTALPKSGLRGCWFFDERYFDSQRNTVEDYSDYGYSAELNGGVSMGQSTPNDYGAANFNASSDQYADTGDGGSLSPSALSEFAVFGIAKLDQKSGANRDILHAGKFETFLGKISNDKWAFYWWDTTDTANKITSGVEIDTDKFASVVGSLTSDGQKLFVDGELRGYKTNTGTVRENASGDTHIGAKAGDGTARNWDGDIAAAGIYNLEVPNAPDPYEIAQAVDDLTDIPQQRV